MFTWRGKRDADIEEELLFVRRPPIRARSNRKKEERIERRIHQRPVEDDQQSQWGRAPFPSYQDIKRLVEIYAATGEGRGAFRAAESLATRDSNAKPTTQPSSAQPEHFDTIHATTAEPLATATGRSQEEKEYYVKTRKKAELHRANQSKIHPTQYQAEVEETVAEDEDLLAYADLPAAEDEVGLRRRTRHSKIHEPPEVRYPRELYHSRGAATYGHQSTNIDDVYGERFPTRASRRNSRRYSETQVAADQLRREEARKEKERAMRRKEDEKRRKAEQRVTEDAERRREDNGRSRRRSGRYSVREDAPIIRISRDRTARESEGNEYNYDESRQSRLRGGAATDSEDNDEDANDLVDSQDDKESLIRRQKQTGRRMPPTKTSAIGGGIIPVPEHDIDTTPWEISLLFFCIIRGRVELSPKIETYYTYQELRSVLYPVREQRTDRWLVKKLKQQYGIIARQSRGLLGSIFSMRRIGFAFFLQYQRTVRYALDPGGFVLTARVPVISPDTEPTSQFRSILRHPPDYKLMLALLDRLVATRSPRQDFYMVEIKELPDAGKIFIILGLLILLCTGGGTTYAVIEGDISTGISIATYALTCFSLFLALVAAGDYIGLKKPSIVSDAYDIEDKKFGGIFYREIDDQ